MESTIFATIHEYEKDSSRLLEEAKAESKSITTQLAIQKNQILQNYQEELASIESRNNEQQQEEKTKIDQEYATKFSIFSNRIQENYATLLDEVKKQFHRELGLK